jgi:hypothetical protein
MHKSLYKFQSIYLYYPILNGKPLILMKKLFNVIYMLPSLDVDCDHELKLFACDLNKVLMILPA